MRRASAGARSAPITRSAIRSSLARLRTATLPLAFANFNTVAIVSRDVFAPRTTSISREFCGAVKKCIPRMRAGREVAAASSSSAANALLKAISVSGRHIRSSLPRSSRLSAGGRSLASITRSARPTASASSTASAPLSRIVTGRPASNKLCAMPAADEPAPATAMTLTDIVGVSGATSGILAVSRSAEK